MEYPQTIEHPNWTVYTISNRDYVPVETMKHYNFVTCHNQKQFNDCIRKLRQEISSQKYKLQKKDEKYEKSEKQYEEWEEEYEKELEELRNEKDELKNELEKIKLERDEYKRQIELNKLWMIETIL